MSSFKNKKKIFIEKDRREPIPLDCPSCNLVLRDWEDYGSVQAFGVCHDCKTNKTKENLKDN